MPVRKPVAVSDRVHRLRIFIQVADKGSFAAAARALNMPPAAVSAAIRAMERELDARVLHRTTRKVSLTHEGQRILPMARKIAGDLEEIYAALRADRHTVSGRFTLDVPGRIATQVIAPAMPSFLQQHPALELHVSSTDGCADIGKDGIDCAIRLGEVQGESLLSKPLGVLKMVSCASSDYLIANGTPSHPDELINHWAIGYSSQCGGHPAAWTWTAESGGRKSMEMKYRIVVNSIESYVASCRAGLGLIQVPRSDVEDLLASGELVEVLQGWDPFPVSITVLYPYRYQRSFRMAAIVDWLQELFARRERLNLTMP